MPFKSLGVILLMITCAEKVTKILFQMGGWMDGWNPLVLLLASPKITYSYL